MDFQWVTFFYFEWNILFDCLFFYDPGLSRAQRSLATSLMSFQFECIGSSQTDDEIVIAGSLKEFGRLINAIEDERDRMVRC